jgi:transposase
MEDKNTAARGRPARPITNPSLIIKSVVLFLQMLIGEKLARRLVSIVLVAVGIPNERITEATGLSDRSIWTIKKSMQSGDTEALFVMGHGGGRTSKAKGIEAAVAEELGKNNYSTRQQVADMILEKFDIKMSVSAVGKLLKKTASGG